MSPEQVVALLAILADQRLTIDHLAADNAQLRRALAEVKQERPAEPADQHDA